MNIMWSIDLEDDYQSEYVLTAVAPGFSPVTISIPGEDFEKDPVRALIDAQKAALDSLTQTAQALLKTTK